ncbi:MAG: hypothetical protein K2Q22_01570, partial [Cytophagales bacterium]|nr:hypothetical protein [Cytophagales bacterium]
IAEVFVLSSTAPGSVVSNPSNFTSRCSSLVINKQPTVSSTLPLPIDVIDAVKGGVYTRSYNFILSDSKATNYNGYLNFKTAYDPTLKRVALRALVTNSLTLATSTTNLTNLTVTASGTAFTNTFLRLTDVPNGSTIVFQEDVQVVSCFSGSANSNVQVDNYCTGTTPSDFCSTLALFGPRISDGGKTTKVEMVKQTIVRDGGQTVYNFDATLGISAYTQTAIGMCFSQSTGYTNTITFKNTSEGTLEANNLSLRIINNSSTFVPFELIAMTILGANGLVKGSYTSSSLGYVPIPELATFDPLFSGRPISCLPPTSLRELDQVWVNALTISGMTATVPSFISLKRDEQLILSVRDYICCASLSLPGVYYDFTQVNLYSKGECSPGYAYNAASVDPNISFYNAKESSANTYATKMAGGSVAGFNGDQQQISIRLLNIDSRYSKLYDINDASFVFTVRTQHGLTSDLTNPSNNPFLWSGLSQHPATMTLQLNNSSVFYILTLSGYNQDNNATSIVGLAPTFTNDPQPKPLRSAHEFIYKIPFKTLYNLASTLTGAQFGTDVVQNIQALLNGAVITTNLKAYCTFLPNSFFNVEMGFEPKSTCPTGACANLMGRYAGRILVNCPGCAIPGAIVKSVSTGRIPACLGYTDDNNDRIADNLSTCTSCHKDWARKGDILETSIGISFSDGDVSKGGFEHSRLLNSTASIIGLDETMTQIKNFGNQSVIKVEVSTALGAAWITVPDSYIFSNNGSVTKTPGVPLPISNDLVVRVPSTLLGMNKRFFSFTSSSGSNDYFNLKITHQITGSPSTAPDNITFDIFTFASDIPVQPSSNSSSDVCAQTCIPLASITSGLQYWCEKNAGMYRFIPYNSLTGFSSPGIGGDATGTYCSPTLQNGVSSFPSSSDYQPYFWMPGFEKEYRGLETATAFQVFVPSSLQLDYFTVSNYIRLTTTALGDNIYAQKLAVFTNSGLCTSTAQPGGRMYTLTFPYALVTPTIASSIILNSNVITTATGTTKLFLSDDAFYIQVGTVLRYNSCLANTTSSFLPLGDGYARMYYPSPTQFGYPNGVLAIDAVLNYPLADLTISGLSNQNITISDRTFSFPIRLRPLEPKQADGSNYINYQAQFGKVGIRPVENAFITFSNLPSTMTVTGIVTPTGTITSDVNGVFRMGTIDPNLSGTNGVFWVLARYLCDDNCQPTESQGCLNGHNFKLNYGWNCQRYPVGSTTTALSGFCNVKSIDYFLTTALVQYGASATLSVNGTALANGATRDFCEKGVTVGYTISEQAIGQHNRFTFETLLPPGYSFDPLATVTFNGVTITATSSIIANTTGTGSWLQFPNLSVPDPSNPDTPLTGVSNGKNPIFSFCFPVTSQCAKLPGTNTFKFRVLAENYCGKVNVVEPNQININLSVPPNSFNVYSLSISTTTPTVLACPSTTGMTVTLKLTKLSSKGTSTGNDFVRLVFPPELKPINTVNGFVYNSNTVKITVLGNMLVGQTATYTIRLIRSSNMICATRTINADVLAVGTLTCPGYGLCTTTANISGVQSPIYISACLPTPNVYGPTVVCSNSTNVYSISYVNYFPSNTLWTWSATNSVTGNSSYCNLSITTVTGSQASFSFGTLPGVDFVQATANIPDANTLASAPNSCMSLIANARMVETIALPLNRGNFSGNIYMTNGNGPNQACVGQVLTFRESTTVSSLVNRISLIPPTGNNYNWYANNSNIVGISNILGGYITAIYTTPGIYTVTLSGTLGVACPQKATQTITISSNLPVPSISGINAICGNSTANFSVANISEFPSNTQFNWSVSSYMNNSNLTLSATTGSSINVAFGDKPGVDNLVLSASGTGTGLCSGISTTTGLKAIVTNPLPLYEADYTGNILIPNTQGFASSYCLGRSIPIQWVSNGTALINRTGVPVVTSTSLIWDLGTYSTSGANKLININYTVSGVNPIIYKAQNNFGCYQESRSTVTISSSICNDCIGTLFSNSTMPSTLGMKGQTTTLTGGGNFYGSYLINGTLVLQGGTYTFMPGSKLYVAPTANIIASNAILTSAGATFTSAVCDSMWQGIILINNSSIYTD